MALDTATQALMDMVKGAKAKYGRATRTVKVKEGKTRVRIMRDPAEPKFWRDLGVHWIKLSENGKVEAVVGCNDAVHEQPCVICTAINKAAKATQDDEALKVIKSWEVRKSVLVNALVRDGADANEAKAQILELPSTAFSQILTIFEEFLSSDINVLDYNTGVDFIIERRGAGKLTEYTVMTAPTSKPVSLEARKTLNDLDAFIEREFFRGDERKALNAIAQFTGDTSILSIGGPRGTAALTAPVGTVAGAEVLNLDEAGALSALDEVPSAAPAPAPVAVAVAPVRAAPVAPAAVAPAPAARPAPVQPPVIASPPTAPEIDPQVDDILAELDRI